MSMRIHEAAEEEYRQVKAIGLASQGPRERLATSHQQKKAKYQDLIHKAVLKGT